MAPEIPEGKAPDARTDLYELGLTLYQALNDHRLPFIPERQFTSHREMAMAIQLRLSGIELPPPKGGSEAAFAVLRKACAYRPEDRYQSAAEMREALEALLKEETGTLAGEKVGTERDGQDEANPKEAEASQGAETREDGQPRGNTGGDRAEEKEIPAGTEGEGGRKRAWRKAAAIALCVLLAAAGLFWAVLSGKTTQNGTDGGETIFADSGRTETLAPDAPEGILIRVRQEAETLGIIPDSQGCRIPISLADLTALKELDAFLLGTYGNGLPEEGPMKDVRTEGERFLSWKDGEGRTVLEARHDDQQGMTGWSLSLLLEDRVNGWFIQRMMGPEEGWVLRWDPPLRTKVSAEYSPEGTLIRVNRGGQTWEAAQGLPDINGVAFLATMEDEREP